MSDAPSWIQSGAGAVRGYMGQVNAIVEKAARTDEKGTWGVDPWITIVHDLIDLQMRTVANGVQLSLAGPWWLQPADREPPLSRDVTVSSAPYPRALSVAASFERVGRPGLKIPDRAIAFVPEVLGPGATVFKIRLTDSDYIGANYTGKVGFRRVEPGGGTPLPPLPVTVGL
jgi:hypothetical protein